MITQERQDEIQEENTSLEEKMEDLIAQDFMETYLRVRGYTEADIHMVGAERLYGVYNALLQTA